MRIVVAPNSLKGSCAAIDAAGVIAEAITSEGAEAIARPMADGGEGTAAVLVRGNAAARIVKAASHDPLGRPISAEYMLVAGRACIDLASASGLTRLSPSERDPLRGSTHGTGELIRDALDRGVRAIMSA